MNKASERVKRYRGRMLSPCIDCGKLCDHRVQRCKSCALKLRWAFRHIAKGQPIQNYCIDCNKPICHRSRRCRECALIELRRRGKEQRRENSPSWKGGRFVGTDGYVRVLDTEHPRNIKGYVLEHYLVWEKVHSKLVPKGWHIHHLNGITYDNRPRNLIALPSKKHYLVLQAAAKRIQELEALLNGQGQLL